VQRQSWNRQTTHNATSMFGWSRLKRVLATVLAGTISASALGGVVIALGAELASAAESTVVYVANSGSNTVSAISAATNTVLATIPVDRSPWVLPQRPNGQLVFVPNGSSASVNVISTATNTVVATVPCRVIPRVSQPAPMVRASMSQMGKAVTP